MRKAKITFEVDNCAKCPFHRKHRIKNADPLDKKEHAIYCSEAKAPTEEWTADTYDGYITDRVVINDGEYPEKYSKVPDWCPFILGQYLNFISEICDSHNWRSYMRANTDNPKCLKSLAIDCGENHAKNTAIYASNLLDEFAKNDFKSFAYGEDYHSVERDKRLMQIVALLRFVGAHEPRGGDLEKIVRSEFLDHSGLSAEDQDIIIDGILNWYNSDVLIEYFDKIKEISKVHRQKPVLDTSTAIKVSLCLATLLDVGPSRITPSTYDIRGHESKIRPLAEAFKKIEKVEFRLSGLSLKNAAELHYTVENGFDVNAFKLAPQFILQVRDIAKDFLGLRSFKFFVNDKEINVNRFKKT